MPFVSCPVLMPKTEKSRKSEDLSTLYTACIIGNIFSRLSVWAQVRTHSKRRSGRVRGACQVGMFIDHFKPAGFCRPRVFFVILLPVFAGQAPATVAGALEILSQIYSHYPPATVAGFKTFFEGSKPCAGHSGRLSTRFLDFSPTFIAETI